GAVNRTDSWGLVRYLKDGTKDPSFGDGGRVLTPGVHYGLPSDIVVQPDGKILVAGGYQLARYNSDGSLDGSFGDAGIASVPVDAGANLALSLGPNGAILAGGNVGRRFALKRFTDDGVLDSTFGHDGGVTTGFGAMF